MEQGAPEQRIRGGIGADEEYWNGLAEGDFRLPRCARCERWTWPAHFRCGECGSWKFEWIKLEPEGTVYTWTRVHYVFEDVRSRAGQAPYVTVVAEIPAAAGARVMGVLKGPEEGLRIGAQVKGVIEPASELSWGYPTICWTLRA